MRNKLLVFLSVCFFVTAANARPAPEGFADLVEKLTPAVVNISTTQTIDVAESPLGDLFSQNVPEGSPFNDLPELLKRFYGDRGEGGRVNRKSTSLGSGFVVDPDGYIVTNNHVVDKAEEITVIFSDDTEAKAKVIGKDAKTDIAVLKVDVDKKLPHVNWGDSDKSRVGDWVIAIGNPFGLGGSVSAGIISARARDINSGPFDDFIQTDAAINRGNSGGPLFNTDGDVVGVNSAIFSPSGGSVGIGFAVPTSLAEPVVKQLKETGHIKRGWLGVKIQTVTDDIAESLGFDEAKGALVLDVTEDSPAGRAGLIAGDVILSFDGQEVPVMRKLPRMVAETKVGKKVPVVVWRKGKEKTLIVTIARLDEDEEEQASSDSNKEEKSEKVEAQKKVLGMGISEITSSLRKRYNIEKETKGVVIVDISDAAADLDKPIREGDVISSVNQELVESVEKVDELVAEAKKAGRKSVLLLISRGADTLFIAMPVK